MRRPLVLVALAACGPKLQITDTEVPSEPVVVRFATFNVSMFRDAAGALVEDLSDPTHGHARLAASILQEVRPDVLLLNEVDWDADGEAVRLLRESFLAVGQDGREPLVYEHVYVPEVNTGVASGHDLDNDGEVTTTQGSRDYGNDSFGFGEYPGQYGLVVLSRHPIDEAGIRTFQELRWKDMPDAWLPEDWYAAEELEVLRLSSKTHADVPVQIGDSTVHFLVSHPTPPTFDGSDDHNGRRNHDEIRFWADYVGLGPDGWPVDDDGRQGGLDGAAFVIAGDLNADPNDGDSSGDPVRALLDHERVNASFTPSSAGGTEQAAAQGGENARHVGDPAFDTADFNDSSVGNLRIDYVLPSRDLELVEAGAFWPQADDPAFPLVGAVSDHRLVWVDLRVGG